MSLRTRRGGRRVELAREIARGGEGAIHQLADDAELLAKIYLQLPGRAKVAKVSAMIAGSTPAITEIAAWPADLLLDQAGHVVGFTMRKIAPATGLHELYSPRSRALTFPEADMRFLVLVAANTVRAFGQIHAAGHIIGDVNHNNLLTSYDGRVNLIDCDSFQIKAGSQVYTCDVGVPLFTAPELQGRGFRGLLRTEQHDLFGLALLIFHMLFMGRHPFAGIWQGSGYASIEDHIKAHRFAYGAQRGKTGIERPPNTVALETFGADIASLFEQAFGNSAPTKRPSASTWLEALTGLFGQLKKCPEAASHYYHESLTACPWCPLETATGARLFGRRFEPMGEEMVDVGSLWRAIEAIAPMAPPPALPSEPRGAIETKLTFWEHAARPDRRRWLAPAVGMSGLLLTAVTQSTAVFVLFAIAAAVLWPWVSPAARAAARKQLVDAQAQYDALVQRWNTQAVNQAFVDVQESLVRLRYGLDDLERERRRRLAEAASESSRRHHFLGQFPLADADISMLDANRKQTLIAVYGIETAADINAGTLAQVKGLGLAEQDALLQWRSSHEQSFVFDADTDPPSELITPIEQETAERRHDIIKTIQNGPARLEAARKSIDEARRRLRGPLVEAYDAARSAQENPDRF